MKNLDKIMQEKNISQSELVRKTGLPKSSMSCWIRGLKDPAFSSVVKIADALDVSLDEFRKEQDERKK